MNKKRALLERRERNTIEYKEKKHQRKILRKPKRENRKQNSSTK